MEGVNVLYSWNYAQMIYVFVIGFIIIMGLVSCLDYCGLDYCGKYKTPIIFLLIIIFIITVSSLFLAFQKDRHAITLDETVAYEEFITKYQVLDQKGKILIVKEKDIEESE